MGKRTLNKLIRDEKGQALMIALVLMLVGGLIIPPMLSHMGTGLKAGLVYENKTGELYAADAGIESGIWRLIHGGFTVPPFTLNSSTVNVTIEIRDNSVYKIISTASSGGDSNTTIEATCLVQGCAFLLGNAVTSGGEVTLQPNTEVEGEIVDYYTGPWPSAAALSEFYLGQISGVTPFAGSTIDIKNYPTTILPGPLYRQGNLEIQNSGDNYLVGVLSNTVYVTGDLTTGNNKEFTLNLNNQTIFVMGTINIGGKCTITGSGSIIGVDNVTYAPKTDNNPDNFVFTMSVEGKVTLLPDGNYYGSVAGDVEVILQPGCTLTWTGTPGEGDTALNVPVGGGILTWEINPPN